MVVPKQYSQRDFCAKNAAKCAKLHRMFIVGEQPKDKI